MFLAKSFLFPKTKETAYLLFGKTHHLHALFLSHNSPGASEIKQMVNRHHLQSKDSDDEDDDPLDAFMAGIEAQVEREKKKIPEPNVDPKKGVRGDIDDEDDEESYYR